MDAADVETGSPNSRAHDSFGEIIMYLQSSDGKSFRTFHDTKSPLWHMPSRSATNTLEVPSLRDVMLFKKFSRDLLEK